MCPTKLLARTAPLLAIEPATNQIGSFLWHPLHRLAHLSNGLRSNWRFFAMPLVVAYMDDLFFQMKLAETAKHLGLEVKVASNAESLLRLMDPAPNLVIVDLNARSEPLAAAQKLRHSRPDLRIIGFLSHVQTGLAEQAKSAGFDQVMPRSKFSMNLPEILAAALRTNA
jgi:CheY-like chemotaxis protein